MFTGLVQTVGTLIATEPAPFGKRITIEPRLPAPLAGWPSGAAPPPEHAATTATGCGANERGNAPHAADGACKATAQEPRQRHTCDQNTCDQAQCPKGACGCAAPPHVMAAIEAALYGAPGGAVPVPPLAPALTPGESIAVSGCCLTLVDTARARDGAIGLCFDVVAETLDKTTLGRAKAGDRVNLERSLRAGDAIGGHFVQGHVEGLGTVAAHPTAENRWRLRVNTPAPLMPCVVPKGSVTIDGVSLTVAAVFKDGFDVALIPTTLRGTTLGGTLAGDSVHLETDMLTRTVVRVMAFQHADPG